jgi:hypothetical protein
MKISGESIGFAQKVSLHTYLKYITFALRKREKGKNIVCSYRSNFQKYFSKKMENKQDFNKKNNPEMLFRKALVARYEYDRAVKGEDNGIEHFLQYLINHLDFGQDILDTNYHQFHQLFYLKKCIKC